MKKILEILISIILLIISIILILIFEEQELLVINIQNIILFYLAYMIKKQKKNIMIFYVIICNFLFNTSIAFTNFIDNNYLINSTFFTYNILFTEEISKFIYKILILNNIGLILGVLIIYKFKPKANLKRINIEKKQYICLFFYILLGTLLYIVFKNITIIKNIMNLGYVKSYLTVTNDGIGNYIIIIINMMFIIFFSIKPQYNKKTKVIFLIFLGLGFLNSFKGSRSLFLANLIFLIWYLEFMGYFVLKMRYIAILFLAICFYSQFMVNFRNSFGNENLKEKKVHILELPNEFLKSLNGTSKIIGYLKTHPSIISSENNGKMILTSFYTFYNSFFKPELNLYKKYDLDIGRKASHFRRISYIVNANMVKEGKGIGGNYIVEMYEVGREYGVIILSLFFIMLVYFLENILRKDNSVYLNIFVILLFQKIFLAPRSSYFDILFREYIYICLVYFIVLNIIKFNLPKKGIKN